MVEQEADEKIKEIKIKIEIKIRKCQIFVQYLTVQIVLTEKMTSLITVFPKMLKIMSKNA